MLPRQRHLLEFWILTQFTTTAVASWRWGVLYHSRKICAFQHSSVDFHCTYDYPDGYTTKAWIWSRGEDTIVYHSDPKDVDISYRGRTHIADEDKNCTLRVHNVSQSDMGKYLFRFETLFEAWTGLGGTNLKVAVLPFRVRVISNQTDGFIQEGDKVNLTCNTENCTPYGLQITWMKNGIHLPWAKSKKLRFSSVMPSDYGNYSCGLNYSESSMAPITLLDVRYVPKNVSLAAHPARVIQLGSSLVLICESKANPPVEKYSLFKMNGTHELHIAFGQNYTIPAVIPENSGQYFCSAKNALGSQNSSVLSIRVEDPDHLIFMPAALGVLLLGVIGAVALFYFIKRKKNTSSIKVAAEHMPNADLTPGLESSQSSVPDLQAKLPADSSKEVYENLPSPQKSDTAEPQLTYAELQFQPATSDRSTCTMNEDNLVVYSTIRTERRDSVAPQGPE